jgi:hypothetical protein
VSQELLEKFEFFPLKCNVQRALETYKINSSRREEGPKMKMKVCGGALSDSTPSPGCMAEFVRMSP